jgi:hypothetical protein
MSTRLNGVEDWTALTLEGGFRLGKLAEALRVSERTLRRHFQDRFPKPATRVLPRDRAVHSAKRGLGYERFREAKLACLQKLSVISRGVIRKPYRRNKKGSKRGRKGVSVTPNTS